LKTFHTFINNDIYIAPSGRLAIATELEAVMKVCENVVQTMMGELILQGDEGIPNFQLIWNGAPNIAQAEASIREALMNVDGVIDVVELTSFVEANIFKYNAIIKTKYGTGAINGI
jgi:hypothetical protein